MRLNAALAIAAVIAYDFSGAAIFSELRLLGYAVVLVLGTILVFDMFKPQAALLARAVWISTAVLILVLAVIPQIGLMQLRQQYGSASGAVHDDPIQNEAAIQFLLEGRNPYVENFDQTDLVEWSKDFPYGIENPSIYHVIALPGHLLISALLYLPIEGLTGFFDQRIVYLLAYLAALLIASRIGKNSEHRLRSVLLIGLSPIVLPFFILGRNDIFVFSMLVASFFFLIRNRIGWSTAFLAIACTIKLFAWVFVPFFIAYLYGRSSGRTLKTRIQTLLRPAAIFAAITIAVVGPFLAWNADAFFDDTIRYSNGTSPTSYPINGLGLSVILMRLGVIQGPTDYYPFWIFQLVFVGPLLWLLLPRLARSPRPSAYVYTATFVLFVLMFFSRFMNDNYLGLFGLLAAAGYGLSTLEKRDTA